MMEFLFCHLFKTLYGKKETILQSERGVNSILITILRFWPSSCKYRTFCLTASFWARWEDHLKKMFVTDRSSVMFRFWKLGSEVSFIYFWHKNGRLFCCNSFFKYTPWNFRFIFKNLKNIRIYSCLNLWSHSNHLNSSQNDLSLVQAAASKRG